MRRGDHLMFFLTLCMMYIAPRLPVAHFGISGPSKSTVSLAIVTFVIWALLKPSRLIQCPKEIGKLPLFILWFSVFSILSTLSSGNLSNIITAVQYFLYAYLSVMLLSHYISAAINADQFQTSLKIIVFISFIYAVGVIVSMWTGPIYPYQVLDIGRNWGGVHLNQGVGFGVNANGASGILAVFCSLVIVFYKGTKFRRGLTIVVLITSLFLTISRAGIIGFMLGLIFVGILIITRNIIIGRKSMGNIFKRFGLMYTLICVVLAIFMFIETKPNIENSLLVGVGLGDTNIMEAEIARTHTWRKGLDNWSNGPTLYAMKGRGFRGTSSARNDYIATSHNFLIAALGDFGILGTLLFFVSYLWLFLNSVGLVMSDNKVGTFGVWTFVSLLFLNMTDSFFYGVEFVFLLTFISILIGICRKSIKPQLLPNHVL